MTLYLAVVFFCANGQCHFWQSKDMYFDQEKCTQVVLKAQQEITQLGAESEGACLKVTTRNNI